MAFRFAPAAITLTAALCLAACGEPEETTYEVDAVDQSGGELIVTDEDPDAVPVDTPDTAMTPAPTEEADTSAMPSAETTPDE